MSGTFAERVKELKRQTGAPEKLEMTCTVDQVYAHYQHEHMELRHPRGGTAKFLEQPLYDHYREYLTEYGRNVLRDGGQRSLGESADHLSDQVEMRAPREWGDLMRSGHPHVEQGERTLHDRPPKVRRLSEGELRAKSKATMRARLAAGLTVYFMRDGKVMVIPGKNDPHPKRGRL
jgi:hypothetical protein